MNIIMVMRWAVDQVRGELYSLVEGLPAELERIALQFHGTRDAVQYYLDFIAFTCQGRYGDSLPMLRYVIGETKV